MRLTNENWLDAQYSVLGAALIDARCVPKVMAETTEDDFAGACQLVYRAMRTIFRRGDAVDPVSVKNHLGDRYQDFLLQLMEVTPTAANVDHYITLCKEQARVLAVREVARELCEADSGENVRQLLDKANSLMTNRQFGKAVSASEAYSQFLDQLAKPARYLSWPIYVLNDDLFCREGNFIIIGAEPSVGKTAFALQCAWYWARNMKVGFFSLETSEKILIERQASALAGVDAKAIKNHALTRQDMDRLYAAKQEVDSRMLDFVPASGYTTSDIRAKIMESGYRVIVVDYLQLVSSRGSSRYEKVTNVSIDLHMMAQQLDVIIVALSQLSRPETDRDPKNSDLRESGQLEQDADVIMMLQLEEQSEPAGPRKLIVTKNKEGELFRTLLAFDGKHQMFTKAQRTGDVVGKYVADGKKARHQNRKKAEHEQFTMLPDSFPVPF